MCVLYDWVSSMALGCILIQSAGVHVAGCGRLFCTERQSRSPEMGKHVLGCIPAYHM